MTTVVDAGKLSIQVKCIMVAVEEIVNFKHNMFNVMETFVGNVLNDNSGKFWI
jgi:hypothetical protein